MMPVFLVLAAVVAVAGIVWHSVRRGGPRRSTTALKQDEPLGKKLFDDAMFFSETHPKSFRENIEKFQRVCEEAEGTPYAEEAAKHLHEWQLLWQEQADEEFEKVRAQAQEFLDAGDHAKAKELWEQFPQGLRTEGVEKKIGEEISRVEVPRE